MASFSSFHDISFPLSIAFGATGGPERRNEIVELTSGREIRNARFAHSVRRYDAGSGVRSLNELYEIIAFFEARRGSLHAFRFRDPFDNRSCAPGENPTALDQSIGVGDGAKTRFKLVKTYGAGADAYVRPIALPVAGAVKAAVGGAELAADRFSFDAASAELVLATAPPNGQTVSAGFIFDVPVRFDAEALTASLTAFKAGQAPSIPLVEVRL